MTKTSSYKAGAEFGFAVPTTVGMRNHDPTRHQAPGYSFGSRHPEKTRPTPGPQYKVDGGQTPRGMGYAPSYSITGRPRRSVWDSMMSGAGKSPGPNTYYLPSSTSASSSPMYSIGGPHRQSKRNHVPAPNSYQLPATIGPNLPTLRGGPSSTLHGKGSDNKGFSFDNARTPGPAGYGPTDMAYTLRRAPAITMKSRTRLPAIKMATPGPGAYDPGDGSNVSKASPRFSLGVRHGENVRPMFTAADH